MKEKKLISNVEDRGVAEDMAKQQVDDLRKERENDVNPVFRIEEDPGKTNTYLLMLCESDEDGEDIHYWKEVQGRETAFDTITEFIDNLDLMNSYITIKVEDEDGISYVNRKTFYAFLKYCVVSGKVERPGFDPDDYVDGDAEFDFSDEPIEIEESDLNE